MRTAGRPPPGQEQWPDEDRGYRNGWGTDDQYQAQIHSFEGCIAHRPGLSFSRYITGQDAPPLPQEKEQEESHGPGFRRALATGLLLAPARTATTPCIVPGEVARSAA